MPKINIDALFICPLTCCLIEDPVSIEGDTTGQLYERKAIELHFQTHDTLPHTETIAKTKKLKTNHHARKTLKEISKKYKLCTLTTFFEAVALGQTAALDKINYLPSYCKARTVGHKTALHLTVANNDEAMVEVLIDDSDLNAKTQEGTTALHIAANKGFLAIVKKLLSAGASLDVKDNTGRTPLHAAALGEHAPITHLLITTGAPLEAKDDGGSTALHFAALRYQVKVAEILLSAGADIEAKTDTGTTPLFGAITWYSNALLEYFLNKGADLTVKSTSRGLTPLHLAAMCGNDFAVERLLAHGADIQVKDICGNTPLHFAVSKGGVNVTRLLLLAGADPLAQNFSQATPGDFAKTMDFQKIVTEQQSVYERDIKRAPFNIQLLHKTIEKQAMHLAQQEKQIDFQQQEILLLKTQVSDLVERINQIKPPSEKKSSTHYSPKLFQK